MQVHATAAWSPNGPADLQLAWCMLSSWLLPTHGSPTPMRTVQSSQAAGACQCSPKSSLAHLLEHAVLVALRVQGRGAGRVGASGKPRNGVWGTWLHCACQCAPYPVLPCPVKLHPHTGVRTAEQTLSCGGVSRAGAHAGAERQPTAAARPAQTRCGRMAQRLSLR